MKSKVKMRNVLLSVLMIAAFALLSPAVLQAQTATTTAVSPADTTATAPADSTATSSSTATASPKPAPATVDTTAETSVGIGSGVTSVASDSNGNVYASLQFSNKVVKMNGAGTELARFTVGGNPTGLIVDNANSNLYVLNNADNTVSKLTLDGALVATYKVAGEGPVHAALYAGTLYIACERSNTLVRMTTAGAALGSTPVGARPVWVAVSVTAAPKSTTTTTTAAPADSTVAPADSTAVAPADSTATVASRPSGSTVNVYVSCNKANQVWKLSSAGGVLATYNSGRGPYGIAINSNGDVLVACFWDAVVLRLSGVDGSVLGKTAVGDGAAGLISYSNVVAVISNGTNTITRLSAVDGSVISTDKVDRSPLIGAATASALWVGCTGSGTIARRAL